jgi:hypothetical protein
MESQEKIITVDNNGKIKTSFEALSSSSSSPLEYQGVLKKTPSTMRTIKSLSGYISINFLIFILVFSNRYNIITKKSSCWN